MRRRRWTGKQIAAELGVSPASVSRILQRLGLNKLEASNNRDWLAFTDKISVTTGRGSSCLRRAGAPEREASGSGQTGAAFVVSQSTRFML